MERVAIDVVGPLPNTTSGNRFILVAVDYFTRWPEAYATPIKRHVYDRPKRSAE